MNIFTCTGNLGKDCEVNNVSGTSVANFSVAFKAGFGDKAQSIWLDCALWGKQAESKLTSYLVKGQSVAVSGELGSREHNGKTYLTLRVGCISLIGGKSEGQAPRQSEPSKQAPAPMSDPNFDDDIPF